MIKNKAKDYLTVELNLYKSTKSSDAEVLTSLKGTTYNLSTEKLKPTK